MGTVPILGTDLSPKEKSPSLMHVISIKGLESESVPMEKSRIV